VTLQASSSSAGTAGKFPGGGSTGSYTGFSTTGINGTTAAAGRVLVYSYFS
jgi:hypothetical protein